MQIPPFVPFSKTSTEPGVFNLHHKAKVQSALAQVEAIGKSQAVIEFKLDGTIVTANPNFLGAMGYTLMRSRASITACSSIRPTRESAAYREFWASLNRGEFQAAQYKRLGKGGKEIWIQASYNPILDAKGKPVRVIKFATDITAQKIQSMEDAGKIAAIEPRAGRDRIQHGRHHRHRQRQFPRRDGLFAGRDPGQAPQHVRDAGRPRQRGLSRVLGQARTAANSRPPNTSASARAARKSGSSPPTTRSSTRPANRSRWSSSPPTSPQQKLKAADNDGQIAAIGKSQAVIEFNMDGTIRIANQNFLDAMGYSLAGDPGQASQHVRRAMPSAMRRPTGDSGRPSIAASTRPANTSGSPRAAARSGSRRPTTRSSISTASRSRS